MAKNNLVDELGRINKLGGLRLIKESEISFNSQFTTPISDRDISVYRISRHLSLPDETEVEVQHSEGVVIWQLDPDMRDFGVKSMGLSIQKVAVELEWVILISDDEYKEGRTLVDTTLPDYEDWKIITEVHFAEDGAIYPNEIEIDFSRKLIHIS